MAAPQIAPQAASARAERTRQRRGERPTRRAGQALALGALVAVALGASGCRNGEDPAIRATYQEGQIARRDGDLPRAKAAFASVLQQAPEHAPTLVALGEMAETAGAYGRAADYYRAASDVADPGTQPFSHLARLRFDRGDLSEALRYVTAAYRFAPEDPSLLARKAEILGHLGIHGAARRAAAQAFLADTSAPGPARTLIDAVWAAEGPDEALTRLVSLRVRNDPMLMDRRLALLDRLGRPEDAIDVLRVALIGRQSEAWRDGETGAEAAAIYPRVLARRLVGRGRLAEAAAVLDARLDAAPADTDALRARAMLALATAGQDAALALIDRRWPATGAPAAAPQRRRIEALVLIVSGDRETAAERLIAPQPATLDGPAAEAVARIDGWRDTGATNRAFADALAQVRRFPRDGALALRLAALSIAADQRILGLASLERTVAALDAPARHGGDLLAADAVQAPLPATAETMRALAVLRAASGEAVAAERAFIAAITRSGGDAEDIVAYADFLEAAGRPGDALDLLGATADARPGDETVALALGRRLIAAGRRDAALALAERLMVDAARRHDDGVTGAQIAVAALGDTQDILRYALRDDVVPALPAVAADALRRRGERIARAAERSGRSVAGAADEDGDLGATPGELRRLAMAAIQRMPGAEAGYLLAAAHSRSDPRAIEMLTEGIANVAFPYTLRLTLAARLEASGLAEAALAEYQVLHAMAPTALIVNNNLASLLADVDGSDAALARADELARRLVGHDVPEFKDTRGWIAARRGRLDEGIALLDEAAQALPDNALVHYHLGIALYDRGDRDRAAIVLQRALTLDTEAALRYHSVAVQTLGAEDPGHRGGGASGEGE
ncbi:MAG: tetratricopeptide repeat protein [Pseudomonadota bacterium]